MSDPSSPMPLIIRGECLREFACWRRRSMKSNSFMEFATETRRHREYQTNPNAKRKSRPIFKSSFVIVSVDSRVSVAKLQVTPHRIETALNSLNRRRERETH